MSGERGSVSVVVAATMTVMLVATMGLADVGRALRVRAQARTAADAAALAAAQELAVSGGSDPAAEAAALAGRNGAVLVACVCAVGSFDAVVTVERPLDGLWLVPARFVVQARARATLDVP